MFKKALTFGLVLSTLAMALPALADSTSTPVNTPARGTKHVPTAAQIACVGSTVNARESALGTAMTSFTQATNAAYSARATALQQAYSQTAGNGVIKTAVKAAWKGFTTSMKSARGTWQTARKSAWSTFRTAVKSCKAPGVTTDTNNMGSDVSGN